MVISSRQVEDAVEPSSTAHISNPGNPSGGVPVHSEMMAAGTSDELFPRGISGYAFQSQLAVQDVEVSLKLFPSRC